MAPDPLARLLPIPGVEQDDLGVCLERDGDEVAAADVDDDTLGPEHLGPRLAASRKAGLQAFVERPLEGPVVVVPGRRIGHLPGRLLSRALHRGVG